MQGRIPRSFIDDILTRVDVVEIINARVPLKKKGREYSACCPFHNEKTPSFTVSPTKQFYHCFGCGEHGTAITFLMEYEHLDFVEAIEYIAHSLGVEVPREKGSAKSAEQYKKQDGLYELMEEVNRFYQFHLSKHPPAQQYLTERGLSEDVIKRFGLGYVPDAWDSLLKQFSKSFSVKDLTEAGLLIEKDAGGQYDRFRDRIMFPIRDRRGRIIGFGGRVMGDGTPKYLNSPETPIFHKGTELYGFYEARQHTRKLERLLVVEGYMDVIALAQFDISYAVATLGTATTQEHVNMVFRAVSEVIFCFDGDRAGREAAWRALQNALTVLRDGKEIRFLFLPTGEDPDSQVRKIGKEAFEEQLVSESVSMTDYLLQHMSEKYNISSREGKSRFMDEMSTMLVSMPDTLIRDQLIADVAKLTSIEENTLRKRQVQSEQGAQTQGFKRIQNHAVQKTPVRYAISLLLNQPSLVSEVENPEQIARFDLAGSDFLATLIETIEENPYVSTAAMLERWRGTRYEKSIVQLLRWQPESPDIEILREEFRDCLERIQYQAHEQQLEHLLHKARSEGLDDIEQRDLLMLLKENNTKS